MTEDVITYIQIHIQIMKVVSSNTATTENKSLFEDGAWNGLGADVIKNLF